MNEIKYTMLYKGTPSKGLQGSRDDIDNICKNNMPQECTNVHGFKSVSTTDSIKNMATNYGYDKNMPVFFKNTEQFGTDTIIANDWNDLLIDGPRFNTTWWSGSNSSGDYVGSCKLGTSPNWSINYSSVTGKVGSSSLSLSDRPCSEIHDNICACETDNINMTIYNTPIPVVTEPPLSQTMNLENKYNLIYNVGISAGDQNSRRDIDVVCRNSAPSVCIQNSSRSFKSFDENDSIKNLPLNYGFSTTTPIITRPNGLGTSSNVIANNWSDLLNEANGSSISSKLKNSLNLDSDKWWSGSDRTGTVKNTCNKWSSVSGNGTMGSFNDNNWINYNEALCDTKAENLCICSTEAIEQINPTPIQTYTNSTILYSLGPGNGNMGGREGVDYLCNEFKPSICENYTAHGFISVNNVDSIKNMPENYGYNKNLPVKGPTREIISTTWETLLTGDKTNTDMYYKLNDKSIKNFNKIWSGSNEDGTYNQNNCNNWTSLDHDIKGKIGNSNGIKWLSDIDSGCGNSNILLCACVEKPQPAQSLFQQLPQQTQSSSQSLPLTNPFTTIYTELSNVKDKLSKI